MSSINFANPWLLLIAVPLLILFAVPFAVAVNSDNRSGHNIAAMVMHAVMALIIAFAAAGTYIQTTVTETDVYVVCDVSYSASKNLDTVDGYIKALGKNLPKNSKMGVICFGKDYRLTSRLGGRFSTVKGSGVDESETDICQALEYAGSLFKEDVLKHVVLISDGCDSDRRDADALAHTVNSLAVKGVKVHAIYLDDNLNPETYEVQLSGAEYTANAFVGKSESVSCIIQSSRNVNGKVTLFKDEETAAEKNVTFTSGYNTVTFALDTSKAGEFDYKLQVSAERDLSDLNNVYTFSQTVTDKTNVLFVAGESSDAKAAKTLFGDNTKVDIYDLTKTKDVPYSVEALCAYDEIYISNADISVIENATAFVSNLDIAVSLFGKSLVTVGDTFVQNAASTGDIVREQVLTSLGDMLPVRYGNSDGEPKLYTIVIDASRSMELLYKMIIAKAASQHLVGLLNDDDYVCLVAFDSNVRLLLAPMRVGSVYDTESGQTVRERAIETIVNLEPSQGTAIGAGLREAASLMSALTSFGDKQVMLISDGLNYTKEKDDPLASAENLSGFGIVTHVLDVGRGADTGSAATAAKKLLADIADAGGGKLYEAKNNVDNLKDVVFTEMSDDVTVTRVEKNSYLSVARRYDGAAADFDPDAKYFVSGYIYGKAKAGATTVLTVEFSPESGTNAVNAPLYSRWRYGNGKVAAYSGLKLGDSISILGQTGYADINFFSNVHDSLIPEERTDAPFTVEKSIEGKHAVFTLTPPEIMTGAEATVSVTLPDGTVIENSPCSFKTTCYGYDLALPSAGAYQVTLTYAYGGISYSADKSFYVDFLSEYDEFQTYDASVLYKAVGANGAVSTDGKLKIRNDPKDVTLYTVKLSAPLLVLAAALWVADIIVRKLKWADVKSFFAIKKKGGGKA